MDARIQDQWPHLNCTIFHTNLPASCPLQAEAFGLTGADMWSAAACTRLMWWPAAWHTCSRLIIWDSQGWLRQWKTMQTSCDTCRLGDLVTWSHIFGTSYLKPPACCCSVLYQESERTLAFGPMSCHWGHFLRWYHWFYGYSILFWILSQLPRNTIGLRPYFTTNQKGYAELLSSPEATAIQWLALRFLLLQELKHGQSLVAEGTTWLVCNGFGTSSMHWKVTWLLRPPQQHLLERPIINGYSS